MMKTKPYTNVYLYLLFLAACLSTSAADRFWTNNLGGVFQTAANWSPNIVPGAADNAFFNNIATLYQVSWIAPHTNASAIFNAPGGRVIQNAIGSWMVTNRYVIGENPGVAPTVELAGGVLRVNNAAGSAVLEVRHGTNQLSGGLVEADRLVLTNTAGRLVFNGGTLVTRESILSNGATFAVGAGAPTRRRGSRGRARITWWPPLWTSGSACRGAP